MATSFKKARYKVKKGDTLTFIAKAHKHAKWQTIWNAPENKGVVSKRKKPENIEPGDLLVIPLNEAQSKAYQMEVYNTQCMLDQETRLVEQLDKDIKRFSTSIKNLKNIKATSDKAHKELVVMLSNAAKDAKRWGSTVDAIAAVAGLMKSLTKLTMKAHKATKLSGDALEALNNEMAKDALNMAYDPIAKQAKKAAAKHVTDAKNGYNLAIAGAGIVWQSFDKMTSPSFWAWTVTRLRDGDSWSDAVTYDFQAEVKQKISNLVIRHQGAQKELDRSIKAKEAVLINAKKEKAASQSRVKDFTKKLRELEADAK
ncbi:MAG: LysM peptidoglycan-binding domain-containing protein [Marinovum sp.]|nr:LysM peptidoglycan-binding domain-containing protein [Marinovum sp.]